MPAAMKVAEHDIVYVLDNGYEVRYYWSVKTLAKGILGWSTSNSTIHVFRRDGQSTQIDEETYDHIETLRQQARKALTASEDKQIVDALTAYLTPILS